MFKEFIMVFLLITIHEIGHLSAALYFKWNASKIVIYPFGGCLRLDEKINRSSKEELIILLFGPLMQTIFYLFISNLNVFTYRNLEIFKTYHYTLLAFNLMPIYPLDGGRLLNIFVNYFIPFKKGNRLTSYMSIIILIILIVSYQNLNFILMGVLLLCEIISYIRNQNNLYNRMLLERYIFNFKFKKFKIIKNKNNMFKNKRHIILVDNNYITEKDYLSKRFKVKS